MTYEDRDRIELLRHIRDIFNSNSDDISPYPDTTLGVLQNIRDLVNANTDPLTGDDMLSMLRDIRDFINLASADTSGYENSEYGYWRNIRDLLNSTDEDISVYPDGILYFMLSARDFLLISGWPQVVSTDHLLLFDGASFLRLADNSSQLLLAH